MGLDAGDSKDGLSKLAPRKTNTGNNDQEKRNKRKSTDMGPVVARNERIVMSSI